MGTAFERRSSPKKAWFKRHRRWGVWRGGGKGFKALILILLPLFIWFVARWWWSKETLCINGAHIWKCFCNVIIETGRVHTEPEKGQWRLDISTLQKSSSFVIQSLWLWLSWKLPTLISRGWRGGKNLLKAQGCSLVVYCALGFNSRPLPEEATGIGASCTLTCLDWIEVFCPCFQGWGMLFDLCSTSCWDSC